MPRSAWNNASGKKRKCHLEQGDSCPFTPRLEHMQRGLVLFSFHKTVIGKCVQTEPAGMIFTIFFRLEEKFHYMGRKTIHVKRYGKAYHIHGRKQFQCRLNILPTAEGQRFFRIPVRNSRNNPDKKREAPPFFLGLAFRIRRFIRPPPLTVRYF